MSLFRKVTLAVAALAVGGIGVLTAAPAAQAAPYNSAGYPRFSYEGRYPGSTPCSGHFRQVGPTRTASWRGRTISLKYFYSDGCGSFARIDNATPDCWAVVDRTPGTDRSTWAWVGETVDPGINYAYTKMANNLNGRYSRGALACSGTLLARTDWY